MSVESNKAAIRQHLSHTDKLSAQDGNWAICMMPPFCQLTQVAFAEGDATIHELVAEGDWVVARLTLHGTHQCEWMGIPATGKRVAWEAITMFQFADGKIVHIHSQADVISLMRQLSAPPEPVAH